MIRISAIVWAVVLVLLGIGLFQVKYNVQAKERDLRDVRRQIEANYSSIHVLDAEWSYLNDPLRLADLARRHTELTPTTPAQIGDFASLPARIEEAPAPPDERGQQQPLVSSAPQAPKPSTPAAPVVQVKAGDQPVEEAPKRQAKQEPKPLKPKDEQAEADATIDAILSDMQKAQDQTGAGGQ
jgi:hypothetical protein